MPPFRDQLEEATRHRERERRELSGMDVNWKRQSKKVKVGESGGVEVREGDLNLDMEIRREQLPPSLRRYIKIRSGWPEGRMGEPTPPAN